MKLGFIGAGNMAQAMIGGVLRSGVLQKDEIIASAATEKTIQKVKDSYGIATTLDNREVAKADILFLAVKPVYFAPVIEQIREELPEGQVIVSIAAGKTLAWLEDALGKEKKIIRTMPNTPALVGEAITAVCPNGNVTEEETAAVCDILCSFGEAEVISESVMDAVVAVSGSSPAYIFILIEAMADAAVAEGMPRQQAYRFAAQSVLGSARMVLETGKHPAELKDMVCSPAGTTIEAVRVLEQTGLRSSMMEAMKACADKSRNM
ncbi:MAG: pyrroline-5-carboxylate reductase [Clostridiaceae bacterium]|nr:pyrroline-5-carboxylate reductase [Clostridiaceae bacterium]